MSELTDTLVDALYRGLLGRAPEPQGLAGWSAWLRERGVAEGLTPLLQSFIEGPEFRERAAVAGVLATPAPPQSDHPPYRHAVSLGAHCYPSQLLKTRGLKRWSGPFDWIFSSPAMVRHCLRDDFTTLLDPAQVTRLRPATSDAPGRSEHAFYRDAYGLPGLFNHHDMTNPDQHAYLQRCVGRLRRVLHGREPSLFLLVVYDHADALRDTLALAETLRAIAPAADLLAVAVTPPSAMPLCFAMQAVHHQPGCFALRFTPTSRFLPLRFDDAFDDLLMHRILRAHQFDPLEAP